jgi:hypothetical protein
LDRLSCAKLPAFPCANCPKYDTMRGISRILQAQKGAFAQ